MITKEHGLVDERSVAAMLGCSVPLVRKWRLFRTGPAWSKVGRLVRYDRRDVEAYIAAHKVTVVEAA